MGRNSSGNISPNDFIGADLDFDPPSNVTIGSSSTLILDYRLDRTYVVLTNDSDEKIYLGIEHPAEMYKGICIWPRGIYTYLGPKVYTASLYGICNNGNARLLVQTAGV